MFASLHVVVYASHLWIWEHLNCGPIWQDIPDVDVSRFVDAVVNDDGLTVLVSALVDPNSHFKLTALRRRGENAQWGDIVLTQTRECSERDQEQGCNSQSACSPFHVRLL
jgi:hypothetical protein